MGDKADWRPSPDRLDQFEIRISARVGEKMHKENPVFQKQALPDVGGCKRVNILEGFTAGTM